MRCRPSACARRDAFAVLGTLVAAYLLPQRHRLTAQVASGQSNLDAVANNLCVVRSFPIVAMLLVRLVPEPDYYGKVRGSGNVNSLGNFNRDALCIFQAESGP